MLRNAFSAKSLVFFGILVAAWFSTFASPNLALGQLRTWDKAHRIDQIDVTLVYFVPQDATPLVDWQERLTYYARRIEKFHAREYQGLSKLTTKIHAEPFRSERTIDQLREGDANAIFFRTLGEVDEALKFGKGERKGFPILLVMSEINWRPLDDFYRVHPGKNGQWEFEGNYNEGRHFPGAESGGARATFLTDRGCGWGLVSGDGWRVPYSGSDCVVYHEGVGHTVGLPHNEPGDQAVMSLGQYYGWINQSWIDRSQKERLGWREVEEAPDLKTDLFTHFTALAEPTVPKPNSPVSLRFTWPEKAEVKSLRVRVQTDIHGSWLEVPNVTMPNDKLPETISLGSFDRATPVSYRVDVELIDGQNEELWGYFQVREDANKFPVPPASQASTNIARTTEALAVDPATSLDLLPMIDLQADRVRGDWIRQDKSLQSPKEYGARIEIPIQAPMQYELSAIVEPLDEPNGLILGQQMGGNRFLALLQYRADSEGVVNALENVKGKNFAENPTTTRTELFVKDRLSQVIVRVTDKGVTVRVDGREVIQWKGEGSDLSLSDYWQTPNPKALFLGAYDCRYRFHQILMTPLEGKAELLRDRKNEGTD